MGLELQIIIHVSTRERAKHNLTKSFTVPYNTINERFCFLLALPMLEERNPANFPRFRPARITISESIVTVFKTLQ